MMVIRIKDLKAKTRLGIYDWEQKRKRPIILNLAIEIHAERASQSDNIEDTLDYDLIERTILGLLENTSYKLIEKLIADVAERVLSLDTRIANVMVEADKPGALTAARSVSIAATFHRR
jgi:FolB domain-containing protein